MPGIPTRFSGEFGEEFMVKISADHQLVPPEEIPEFPLKFAVLTTTLHANENGLIAHSRLAASARATGGGKPVGASRVQKAT